MGTQYDRRNFLKLSATTTAGLALGQMSLSGCASLPKGTPPSIKATPIDTVRVGFVGVGQRGTHLLKLLLRLEGVRIVAVCDTIEKKVARAQWLTEEAGQTKPAGYSRDETAFKRLCDRDDLDLVITATPWNWHTPVCVAAMKAGKVGPDIREQQPILRHAGKRLLWPHRNDGLKHGPPGALGRVNPRRSRLPA